MAYNAADRKDIRKAEKAATVARAQRLQFIHTMMTSAEGRTFVYDFLLDGNVFRTTFSSDPLQMAFAEGNRNSALKLLADVMAACPDLYIIMTREANDRYNSNDRSPDRSSAGEQRRSEDAGRDDQGSVDADYDPYNGTGNYTEDA